MATPLPRLAAIAAVLHAAQVVAVVEVFVPPHRRHHIPYVPPRAFPGRGLKVAKISMLYEVDTPDWQTMLDRAMVQLGVGLDNLSLDYLEQESFEPLVQGRRCDPGVLRCAGFNWTGQALLAPGVGGAGPAGNLEDTDPRYCQPASAAIAQSSADASAPAPPPPPAAAAWFPTWTTEAELEEIGWNTDICISAVNTSIYMNLRLLQNLFVTGYRDGGNSRIFRDNGIELQLHVVGVIPTTVAHYINMKFQLNGSIPLPEIQPGLVDTSKTETENLNFTVGVFGIRSHKDANGEEVRLPYLPICKDPPTSKTGCFRIDFNFYEHPVMNRYKLEYYLLWRKHLFMQIASDPPHPLGEFNITQGPWPVLTWLLPSPTSVGAWQQTKFPQKESKFQEDCRYGNACDKIAVAPSPRYLHTAVLYKTWNFRRHAHRYLCNERPDCGADCLTNLTCLGGVSYFQANFYFRSSQFRNDDGGVVPTLGLDNLDCPSMCCKDRRLCMREYDVLGYKVPYDTEMMLVFGGKTYVHEKDPRDGRLVYHNCEQIPKAQLREEWRSCSELTVNDLWRYDTRRHRWEFIKADSMLSPTTGKPVGYPLARYGHGAAIISQVDSSDEGQARIFMYIYGGMGPQCEGGVCNDVWRYEISWAAQAYYPKFPDTDWNRGNLWDRLKDCPFGGRYRHGMVATSGQEYIYIYGGQGLGGFYHDLYRYRVSTDMWENLNPFGRVSLTRLMYDYSGTPRVKQVPLAEYSENIDVDCSNAWTFEGRFAHCAMCPQCGLATGQRKDGAILPTDRGDFSIAVFADYTPGAVDDAMVMFGGYRTTWGIQNDDGGECEVSTTTTTTTTVEQTVLATTESNAVGRFPGLTTTTIPQTTTTTYYNFYETTSEGVRPFNPMPLVPTSTVAATTWAPWVTSTATLTATTTSTTTLTTTSTATLTSVTATATTTTTKVSTPLPFGMTSTTTTRTTTRPPVVAGALDKTGEAAGSAANASGPDEGAEEKKACTTKYSFDEKYYFNDLWTYDATSNQWVARVAGGLPPLPRRGHRIITRRSRTDDTQIVLFGGHNQDKSLNDMWVLDLMRPTTDDRAWTRIDPYMEGQPPPSMSHHTMVYSEESRLMIVFGGLHWKETNLETSDDLRNIDRRCFKEAQGMPESDRGMPEEDFLRKMRDLCQAQRFCCALTEGDVPPDSLRGTRIRTDEGSLNLTAISLVCRADCDEKSFYPEFYPIMSEGVWVFSTETCPGNCSGHGYCDMAQCVCETPWYGLDCSQPRCPGSTCYAHPKTREQFCVDCSQHGSCSAGQCHCDEGWGYDDCSVPLCDANCSSTHNVTRGVCLEDFPAHQCHCFGRWSGPICDGLLCLNNCSGRGACQHGACNCTAGFHGDDCSLFTIPLFPS